MYRILEISERAEASLKQPLGGTGKLHSVFASACNIVLDSGRMVTVQAEASMFSPLSIIVSGVMPDMRDIPIGAGVSYSHKERILSVSGLEFDLSGASVRSCKYIYGPTDPKSVAAALPVMERVYKESISGYDDIFLSPVYEKCRRGMEKLAAAAAAGDEEGLISAAVSLIGLGLGLTPSGDDMLTGFRAAAGADRQTADLFDRVRTRLIAHAKAATTKVSLEFLTCVMEGQYSQATADILDAVCSGDLERCERACRSILKMGSTSGRDCLYGLICGTRLAGGRKE